MNLRQAKRPVAIFAFKRPSTTELVMDEIRRYAPPTLFLVQDGPRSGAGDEEGVEQVRKTLEAIDWPCEVHKIYAGRNLGLQKRFSTALSEIFDQVDECIIL